MAEFTKKMQTATTDSDFFLSFFYFFCLLLSFLFFQSFFFLTCQSPSGKKNTFWAAKLASWLCQFECQGMPPWFRSGATFPLQQCH